MTDLERAEKAIELLEQVADLIGVLDADVDPTISDILEDIDNAKIDLDHLIFDTETGELLEPDDLGDDEVDEDVEDDAEDEDEDEEYEDL